MINIQNIDIYTTPTDHYLVIQKNGCTQILSHIKQNYDQNSLSLNTSLPLKTKPYWTTVREPYERFISGLTYDVLRHYGDLNKLEEIITLSNLKRMFNKRMPVEIKKYEEGSILHTTLQWNYMWNQNLDFIVDIKNLNTFLDVHYSIRLNVPNETPTSKKNQVKDYIDNHPLKPVIDSYLDPDYHLYNQLYNVGYIWDWQSGKMF